ncbi:MAG: PP2C family protein-serine/threonine phosphatase [Desulfovibrio sp.]
MKQRKVLIVDDEPVNLKVLRGILTKSGYEVESANDGLSGRKLAQTMQPDMILLDVMMPGESGFETCQILKDDPATTDIPIIFLTGLDDVDDKINGLDLGAVDYITKPFHFKEVLARIEAQLKFTESKDSIIEAQASRLSQVQTAQQAMLVKPQDLPEASFAVKYITVLEAGGDFYDVLDLGNNTTAYFVADVSGHDLGASFVTSSLKALFRQHASSGKNVEETLSAMNSILCTITPPEVYLTAVYVLLDRSKGQLEYGCAAHPSPVFVSGGQKVDIEVSVGDVLGVFDKVVVESSVIDVAKGDRIYLYTDGLTEVEAGDIASRATSLEKMGTICSLAAPMELEDAVPWVVDGVCGQRVFDDDIVLLGIEV